METRLHHRNNTRMMAETVIAHGRRKGNVRSMPANSHVTVLSGSEWQRMKEKLSSWRNPVPTKAEVVQQHKEALHQYSRSIVKNWENTIEGQRLKKLQAKKLREEKEEEEKQIIDREEAEFQAEKRKDAIERAKTLLYYQTDRIKKLHTALVLSEVMREREAQQAYGKRRQDMLQLQDERFLQQQLEEKEKAILKDAKRAEEKAKEKGIICQYQREQVARKNQVKQKQRQSQLEAQKQLEKELEEFKRKENEKAVKQADVQKLLKEELRNDVKAKEMRQALKQEQEEEEDKKIKKFSQAKKEMEKMKKKKEEEILARLRVQQDQIRDHLHKRLQQACLDEDQRMSYAMQQQEAKREAEEKEKQEKQAASSREMYKHMLQQLQEQEEQQRMKQKENGEMLKMYIAQDQQFKSEEMKKMKKRQHEARHLQDFYVSQSKELRARRKAEDEEDLNYHTKNKELLKVEEKQFQLYATEVMKEVKGRNSLAPFHKAVQDGAGGGHGPALMATGVRPSYLARDSTAAELPSYAHYRLDGNLAKTQRRMGFTW